MCQVRGTCLGRLPWAARVGICGSLLDLRASSTLGDLNDHVLAQVLQ